MMQRKDNKARRRTVKSAHRMRRKHLQRGATSIEYALVATLIAMVAAGSMFATGMTVESLWEQNAAEIIAAIAKSLSR